MKITFGNGLNFKKYLLPISEMRQLSSFLRFICFKAENGNGINFSASILKHVFINK